MIRTLLFDLGNVLVGLDFDRAYRAVAEVTAHAPDEVRRRLFESRLADVYEEGAITSEEFHRRCCRTLEMEMVYDQFATVWGDMFAERPLLDEDFLAALGRRYRMAVVSNTNELHFQWLRERFRLLDHFETLVLSYEVGAAKPAPAIYQAALERTGSRPEECFFTDDREENVLGARALGINAALFTGQRDLEKGLAARGVSWM